MKRWDAERQSQVVELWKSGVNSTQISRIMGLTRGSVIGKLNRLGLLGNPPGPRHRGNPNRARIETSWDAHVFETWEARKARLARERANARQN